MNMKKILCFESDLGYWADEWEDMGSNTKYIVNILAGDMATDKNKLLPISKNEYIPQNGDKVYFLPGVNVPRIKFKNLCDEKGIRTVRDPNKANIFVGNNSSVDKLIKGNWHYSVSVEDFKSLIGEAGFINHVDERHYQNITTALEFYEEDVVMVDRPTVRLIMNYINSDAGGDQCQIYYINEEYEDLVNTCSTSVIYDESKIIDQLNGDDAAVIDSQIYNQLSIMFDSSDSDNHILAMEIMANCKYSASLVHLILLFHEYSYKIYNCSSKNHVNFKSLLSWLNLSSSNSYISNSQAITILKEKGQLIPDKLNLFLSYVGEEVAREGDNEIFTMKQISLKPELLNEMGMNYSYELQEDIAFSTPVIEETVDDATEDEVPESEFAWDDNFDADESIEEPLETTPEEDTVSNNHQTNTQDESSIDWF